MKKQTVITTAANSKTMNAVDNTKLFASAGEKGAVPNFIVVDQASEQAEPLSNKPVGKKRSRSKK